MSELVLHHYPLSPFSEKVRVMLGHTGLDWCSVTTAEMPPRPMLAPLAGGYRKIPVAQIGADVFCDTRTITREIARLAGRPELCLEGVDDAVKAFVAEADLTLFLACILSSTSLKMNVKLFRAFSLLNLLRFLRDRIHIGRTASVPRMGLREARGRVRDHLLDLEQRLASRPYLFGEAPNIGDFSAYHGLWFMREVAESAVFQDHPAVLRWMDRMAAPGHGNGVEMSPERALKLARQAEPRPLPDHPDNDPLLEREVLVAPSDYGQVPTQGILKAALPTGYILACRNPAAGAVHVHFPREGFTVSAI
ncbi:MAG: glutathione S-transferase family protein [Pseudomonadales bacterium]|nr:glutathione S-transferase family protein [Pseudomonadales bacterium]